MVEILTKSARYYDYCEANHSGMTVRLTFEKSKQTVRGLGRWERLQEGRLLLAREFCWGAVWARAWQCDCAELH